jgi:membrane protease YdiL (CAAX protease family)
MISSQIAKNDQRRSSLTTSNLKNYFIIGWEAHTPKILKEALKVTAVAVILQSFAIVCFKGNPIAFASIVTAPITEEILFRGMIQKTIKQFQNRNLHHHSLDSKEKKVQQAWRVRFSGILFGMAHLMNPGPLPAKIVQVTLASIAGISYGYIKEQENSIVPTILLHSMHNTLVVATMMGIIPASAGLGAILGLEVSVFVIARTGGLSANAKRVVGCASKLHHLTQSKFHIIKQKLPIKPWNKYNKSNPIALAA